MDAWVQPGAASTAAFVAVCVSVLVMVVAGARRVDPSWTRKAAAAAMLWAGATAAAVLLLDTLPVVAVFGFFGLCNLGAIALALSPVGGRMATLPLAWLVGFHAFRLPLEIVLHRWFEEGTLPVQMTWSGQNPDVLTGILALGLGLWGARAELPRIAAWTFELVGLGLLLNVMRVAVLSAPTPLRAFADEPPLLLAWHLPYGWIVPLCVSAALFGHLVLARRLLGR